MYSIVHLLVLVHNGRLRINDQILNSSFLGLHGHDTKRSVVQTLGSARSECLAHKRIPVLGFKPFEMF